MDYFDSFLSLLMEQKDHQNWTLVNFSFFTLENQYFIFLTFHLSWQFYFFWIFHQTFLLKRKMFYFHEFSSFFSVNLNLYLIILIEKLREK